MHTIVQDIVGQHRKVVNEHIVCPDSIQHPLAC